MVRELDEQDGIGHRNADHQQHPHQRLDVKGRARKPQYANHPHETERSGDDEALRSARARFEEWCSGNGYRVQGRALAGVAGTDGNQEYFYQLMPQPQ